MPEPISCESRISRVVVYARGAIVTRMVELPVGIPPEGCELVVGGVTPLAEPGSVRTQVDGERRVTGVQAPLAWPSAPQPVAPDTAAIVAKQREIRRANLRLERVRFRIEHLEGIEQNANLQAPKRRPEQPMVGVNERLGAALETADLVAELLGKLDAEERALRRSLEKLNNELAQLSQQRPAAPQGGPQRQVRVTLAPGSEHLRALEISYNVSAARWWPAYAARLSNGGKNAEFAVEAFVAQQTLEDWKDARISLCTADMVSDLTLPELQSLRLGRAQPAKRSGFREPPEGLDALFSAHDQAFGGPGMQPPADLRLSTAAYTEAPVPQPSMIAYAEAPAESGALADYDEVLEDRMEAGEYEERPARRDKEMAKGRGAKAKKMAAPQAAPAPAMSRSMDMESFGAPGGGMAPPEPEAEPEPEAGMGDQWLDFDSLELAHNNTARRGRLVQAGAGAFSGAWRLQNAIESMGAPGGATDPLYSRGMFDHQFEADGLVEVPSDARPQRIRLLAKAAKSRMALRCVPLEDERVFREVEIENPLEAPLLPGPVDVFMDGALLITSEIKETDRGGTIRFGLGEEQRVRVVRNVRAREESKGVFGGKTAMDHEVSLEAASSLPAEIELELIDRIPVSEDKEITVELLASEPKPERYNQHDRHHHLEGGLRWKLALKAGATATAKFTYRIGFDKDFELVGATAVTEPAAITTTARRVVFFEDRAEVARVGKATLTEGRQWVRLAGATILLDDRSVQARALSERVKVLSARVVRRLRSVSELNAEQTKGLQQAVRELEQRVDELEQDRARATMSAGEYLSELIQNWCATLATVPAPGDDSPPAEWARAWQALLTRDEDYLKRRAELLDQADDLRTEVNQKRHELSTGASQRTLFECFIEVQVDASSMDEVELEVKYRTPCALWRPEHLARLSQDAKNPHAGEVEWTTWGVAWQRTGEDWGDVEVAFSTARPAQVADAPVLDDDRLSKRKKTAEERKQVVVQMREEQVKDTGARAEAEMPGVDDGGKPLEFAPKGRYSLPANGQPTRVEIGRRVLKASVARVLIPERAQTAFLKADANWEGEAPILAGPLRLARGGSVVGRSRAKFVAPGEKFETGFGPEDGVRCKRAVREDRETAKLTGSQTIQRKVTLRLSNLGDAKRELEITERIPVSEIEGLEVKLTEGKDWKPDQDGYLRRTVQLEPRANLTLDFSYEIKAKSNVVLPF